MVCLDTSILVPILREEPDVIARLESEAMKGTRVSTTPINLCELYDGAYNSKNPSKELRKVDTLVSILDVLYFDIEACRRFGEKTNQALLKNEPIDDFDLMIACIAMSHGETVATRNVEHFQRVPGLVVEQW